MRNDTKLMKCFLVNNNIDNIARVIKLNCKDIIIIIY